MKNNDIVIAICDDETYVLENLELFLSQCRMSRCDGNNIKFQREDIVEVFNEAMDDLMKTETVCSGTDYIRVREIYYVEALGDGTAIHEKDKITITPKSLKYWEEKLGEDFYRCHKTYLISFFHVLSLNNYHVVLNDKKELPVAVRRWHPMKAGYDEYIRKNARII